MDMINLIAKTPGLLNSLMSVGSTDINHDRVQAAVDLLAPVVEEFGLDNKSIVARMGLIASVLFKSS